MYNDIIIFYEKRGYSIKTNNLMKDNEFRYKLTPMGNPSNFSYFTAEKSNQKFEIRHNLAIESSFKDKTYLTPDISVVKADKLSLNREKRYYKGRRVYYYVKNEHLQTFCEVKHFNPFPELLFSFIGLIFALKRDVFNGKSSRRLPKHIAPLLALSGRGNYHTDRIIEQISKKFKINIVTQLFYREGQIRNKNSKLITIGTKFE